MRTLILLLVFFSTSFSLYAADLANGKAINKRCALCHGTYGQGTPGRLSPRIAGLNKGYMIKAIKEYRSGKRVNPLMIKTSSIDEMSPRDIEDIAAYLAKIDLSPDPQFNVTQVGWSIKKGQKLYKKECKSCHAKDGYGKSRKKAPALAGQHYEYLFTTLKLYQQDNRVHDDDPDDDLFDDYGDGDLLNLTAYLVSLDDKKIRKNGKIRIPNVVAAIRPKTKKITKNGLEITNISQTVAKMNLEDGVSIQDAIDAMLSKAAEKNLKLVGQQHVSKELESRGIDSPYLSILQFCDPMDAKTMIISNPILASYMPCRIAIVEDQEKRPTLMMLNLDMLINNKLLPPDIIETAIRVNQDMLDIMVAGATGDF